MVLSFPNVNYNVDAERALQAQRNTQNEKFLPSEPYRAFCCMSKISIPNFRRQPGNRSRLKCVYGFIMELVSFSSIILKLIMISLLCKRLLILHYLTNVHM